MGFPLASHVSVSEDILVKELEGEAVLLNLKTESYFGLDEVGTRMWNVLTSSNSIQDAHKILLQEYEVDQEVLIHDIENFVKRLIKEEMIKLAENE